MADYRLTAGIASFDPFTLVSSHLRKVRLATQTRSCRKSVLTGRVVLSGFIPSVAGT